MPDETKNSARMGTITIGRAGENLKMGAEAKQYALAVALAR